jgi:hypothetical protein
VVPPRVPAPPGSKPRGEACAADDECGTGFCTDGVCCDAACEDACLACNLPDNRGTCVAVPRGGEPAHGGCDAEPSASCGRSGLCDGSGGCQLYDATTVCAAASCDSGSNTFLPQSRCDGQGSCAPAGGGLSCAPFRCKADGSGCADRCSNGSECVSSDLCSNESCGKIGNGLPCRNPNQCQSGFCVDGVCCNAPCGEQCMACDVTGALGTCTQVPAGLPRGGRPPCAGAGTGCGGSCTPASTTSCTYPGGETTCRSASCVNTSTTASQTTAAACDGQGSCGAGVTTACGVYLCAANGTCGTTCVGDFDCAGGHICRGGACVSRGGTATACSSSAECADGLTCKDGVCCESACGDACRSCNVTGQEGRCVVVASADDPDTCPADTRTCNGAGACTLREGQICSSASDCGGGTCTTYYPDADGDGYGDRAATRENGRAKGYCGSAPAGWSASNTDCCDAGDTMRAVHPGQTAWFTAETPCGGFDYDCDGEETPEVGAGGSCVPLVCMAGFTAETACGVAGSHQACDGPGASCADPVSRTQGCR